MSNESFDDAVSGLLERLDVHEKAVEQGAGRPRVLQEREDRPAPSSGVAPLVASLEESFKDMRECVLNKLRGYREDVTWTLPAGARARVSPGMLARIYRSGRTYENYVSNLIKQRGLEGCHLASEWMMLAILIDRAVVEGGQDWINLKSTEMAMRRLYGIERALENVRSESDWKQPKGGFKGWKTKVNFLVLNELDPVKGSSEDVPIEGVERELRERLAQKALLQKTLDKLEDPKAKAEG